MRKPTETVLGVLSSDDPYVRLWLRTLEDATEPGRLARGRLYYAVGKVAQVQVEPGVLRGLVSGTREAPYQVSIQVKEYSDLEWKAAERVAMSGAAMSGAVMSGAAMSGAAMSDQHSPHTQATEHILGQLDQIFRLLGICTLSKRIEIGVRATCSCPDYEEMCKHVAALWYEFGERAHSDPSLFIPLFGGSADSWTRALGQSQHLSQPRNLDQSLHFSQSRQPAADREADPPMVLLPADAERNLQDRSIAESLSRYWRPIREIRQPDDDGAATREAGLPVELELPSDGSGRVFCEDPAALRRSLERMYAEIRRRAAEIRHDIESPQEQDVVVVSVHENKGAE